MVAGTVIIHWKCHEMEVIIKNLHRDERYLLVPELFLLLVFLSPSATSH